MHQAAPNVEEIFFEALELDEPGGPGGVPRQSLRRRRELRRRVEQLLAARRRGGRLPRGPGRRCPR